MDQHIQSQIRWFVAHTRPRCEKKLAKFCRDEGIDPTLPCYKSVKKHGGKIVEFKKLLFPSYLFLQMSPLKKRVVYQSDYVANLLDIEDQETFKQQLGDILRTLEMDVEMQVEPQITEGSLVQIKSGPFQGMEGWVETRTGRIAVTLRLDFIGQSAVVKMDACDVELVT